MRINGILGLALLVSVILGAIALGGTGQFVNPPALVLCIVPAVGLGLMSFGTKGLIQAARAVGGIFLGRFRSDLQFKSVIVIRAMIGNTYASGIIGTLIGIIHLLLFAAKRSGNHWAGFGIALLPIFYASLFCECIFRPALNRIEFLKNLPEQSPSVK